MRRRGGAMGRAGAEEGREDEGAAVIEPITS